VLGVLAVLLVAGLAATGCVSVPSGGPVASYPVTQGTAAQNQPYVQIQPQQPGANWTPQQIVEGFLTASASWGSYPQVVREYLTPDSQSWNPSWAAYVYKSGPTPTAASYPSGEKKPTTAKVRISGVVQATLFGYGTYSVPSSTAGGPTATPETFTLVKVGGQWRIKSPPPELLLTSDSFQNDYQLRNLYFFDPMGRSLVPDPVYVPVPAKPNDLMDGLVNELITPPANDWLSSGATMTAFPAKTKVSSVTLDGVTAVVNLTGTAIGKAGTEAMERVSAQLFSTLSASTANASTGQVKSIEVVVNGHQWTPPDNPQNPVQAKAKWGPAYGKSGEFYYVTSAGYLTSRDATGKSVSIVKIGTGYSQIAISPDGTYLAALRGSTLYTGFVASGQLTKRGTGFASMSWDVDDDLWAAQAGQIVVFRGTQDVRQPLAQMTPVNVIGQFGTVSALQVAPDGVRVAIVMGGNQLTFGGISLQQPQEPKITLSLVQDTLPIDSTFTALTWYGPDDVITLAHPGPTVTEYPVSGGNSQSIQATQDMRTITASWGQPLVAGLQNGFMKTDASPTGSWSNPISDGDTPVNGISPIYPG
jgi:hypothetical protein